MKKVMVLTIVITLLATSAFAVVRNTKHDLSSTSTGGLVKSDNYSEVCVFCHTPHNGQTGMLAPLWNRSHVGKTYVPGELYNSATLETVSQPSSVEGAVSRSDAKLCMSCHDGTNLDAGLLNPANSAPSGAQPNFNSPNDVVSTDADLGASLVDDHPIGMDYLQAVIDDGELEAATGSVGDNEVSGLPLYFDGGTGGTNKDVMWCSSCHDVHDNGFPPFLMADNAGSALCTTCHQK